MLESYGVLAAIVKRQTQVGTWCFYSHKDSEDKCGCRSAFLLSV